MVGLRVSQSGADANTRYRLDILREIRKFSTSSSIVSTCDEDIPLPVQHHRMVHAVGVVLL